MNLKLFPFCNIKLEDHPWKNGHFWHPTTETSIPCFLEGSTIESDDIEAWNKRASPWIPVSERLPDDGQECLYRLKGPGIDKPFGPFHGNFHKSENGFSLKGLGGWMDAVDNIDWMEIPE